MIDWKKSVGYRCSFIYGKISGEFKIIDYETKNNHGYVTVRYKDNTVSMSTNSVSYGNLGILVGNISFDYRYNIGDCLVRKDRKIIIINREKRKETNATKTRVWKWYQIKCLNCQNTHWITESQLRHGSGCPFCIDNPGKLVVGFNDIVTVAPWMIPYFQGGIEEARKYTAHTSKKIYPVCPICGQVAKKKRSIRDIYKYRSIGCQCDGKMSFPELVMSNILDQFNINYIPEATKSHLEWAKSYRYDFYLPDYNCIIETHGGQHYSQTRLIGRTLEEEKINDIKKKELARGNGIKYYFEIDCRNSDINWIIKHVDESGLSNFLNIDSSDIIFDKLFINKYHEKIQECKDIVAKNPNISFAELTRQLGFNHYYDTQKVLGINRLKVRSNRIPVDLYKNDELIKQFSSISEALRESKGKTYYKSFTTLKKYIENNIIIDGVYLFKYADLGGEEIA